jgi:hypothetical protein
VTALAIATAVIAAAGRFAIGRAAVASGRVDHYYWMLAAAAYREQRGLPVVIPDKYLLEDDTQAYPPLFGILLGRCGLDRWGLGAVSVVEMLQAAALAALMAALAAPYAAIILAVALFAATPVLVTYNTQLNSRVVGDLFLFGLLAAEVGLLFAADGAGARVVLGSLAAVLTALVIMTHKMTLQLYTALLLPWSWAVGSVVPLLVFAAGSLLFVALVGPRFAAYQLRAHWDIVRFWGRHWRRLGAHQFRDSPIYGAASGACATCFHQPGVRGVIRHLRVVVSYLPIAVALPLASAVTSSWPPAWVLVWLGAIYVCALATLFVPRLKCLGGGHLYVFNAAAPAALYVGWLPDTPAPAGVLAVGLLATVVSLIMAWRVVRSRIAARDEMFHEAAAALARVPRSRVAVFPLQSAEAVAWHTPHAVLWGAHGYGFSRLEGFFPVLTQPVSTFLREYRIQWVLCDQRFWPLDGARLATEGMRVAGETAHGHWRLIRMSEA